MTAFIRPHFRPAQSGHTRLTGKIFLQDGCDTGVPRAFASRDFTITAEW
ncbi:MAG TPA: hypothetical protein VGU23_07215 [Acidobacteriaceae bacterium]|nr:hypothetical protein [Acidobacteriaceae bacterium]